MVIDPMTDRRAFLASVASYGLASSVAWAEVGYPRYLAAAQVGVQNYALFGLDADGAEVFSVPLAGRGHAAAAHPKRAEAVAFGRRPSTFAVVVNCLDGSILAMLKAPDGRHFYGHGVFDREGDRLYTTENDFGRGTGVIGIWDATAGYQRIAEVPSGGTGPHEIIRLPKSDVFVVANGGIDTHPETGREKLNLPTMRSNLCYLDDAGEVLERWQLPETDQLSSIRHIAAAPTGLVAFACQWQGDARKHPPLQGTHERGSAPDLRQGPSGVTHLNGYAGSVSFSGDSTRFAVTYPRANLLAVWATSGGSPVQSVRRIDVCGVAAARTGFAITSGEGVFSKVGDAESPIGRSSKRKWDNHLVSI